MSYFVITETRISEIGKLVWTISDGWAGQSNYDQARRFDNWEDALKTAESIKKRRAIAGVPLGLLRVEKWS